MLARATNLVDLSPRMVEQLPIILTCSGVVPAPLNAKTRRSRGDRQADFHMRARQTGLAHKFPAIGMREQRLGSGKAVSVPAATGSGRSNLR